MGLWLYERVQLKLQLNRQQISYSNQKNKAFSLICLYYDFICSINKCIKVYTQTRCSVLQSYLLKALLISEQLDALQQLEVVLLKEAVEGGLHVPELGEEPEPQCAHAHTHAHTHTHTQPSDQPSVCVEYLDCSYY